MTDWPEGVSDGLILPCSICGDKTVFDYTVDDEVWNRIVPKDQRLGVICLTCFDQMTTDKGIDLFECLRLVQFVGANKTIGMQPIWSHNRKHRD